ncbi:MAG: hydantoinase/oxoprolinase family protein [Burkholderiales bacterium]|nr:hydantoinase/oxoprolinase family protein [Burkholderiales bacterium]
MDKRIRIGVDVGGTFTDFVLVDEHRDVIYTGKRLTTPQDPSLAITAGIERLLHESGTSIEQLHSIVHGTTLVANTVIERKGAKVGLITTAGFRDVLEMGKEIRYDLYDLFLQRPEALAPRYLRREVSERVDASGNVLSAFDAEGFRHAVRSLLDEGIEAIAVAFIHAYRNPAHERAAKAILAAEFPELPATLSSDVAPEIREFERTSTAVCNAYVQPLMSRYLARLQAELERMGLKGSLYLMLSGGGITTVRAAREYPVRIIESGPAAGAIAASFYSGLANAAHLVAFDMGGTTAKMCLIENGRPEHAHEFEAGRVRRFRKGSGIPLKVPVIDLIEIGAGGGSLAWIDRMGLLKVGPESAGSEPGPVCYGRGGTQPTVTDADLLLGYLSPEFFLGGEMRLDPAAVERAVEEKLARPLGLSVVEAAAGIHSIVNENMAAATRMYIAEKGRDPRRYHMLAFGGAGPVHAYGLAKLLKLERIICPLGAGVMSALGFLVAAPAIDLVRSYVTRLDDIDWNHLNDLYAEMTQEARRLLLEAGADEASISMRRHADMRYVGQGFEVDVPLAEGTLSAASAQRMRDDFLATYRQLFDREIREVPTEALTWRLSATAPVPNVVLNFAGQRIDSGHRRKGTRKVYFAGQGFVESPVYNRYALLPGTSLHGPAIVEERESTVVAGPDARISIDSHLNLIIDIEPSTTGH